MANLLTRPARGRAGRVLAVLAAGALVMVQLPFAGATMASPLSTRLSVRAAVGEQHQLVWEISQGSFNPANGTDAVSQTFVPTTTCYQLFVTMRSSDGNDAMYVQLGDNSHDGGEVQSGA